MSSLRTVLVPCVVIALVPLGCENTPPPARPVQVTTTSGLVPTGVGTVAAVAKPDGNTSLDVDITNLAPPESLAPDATVYVVWVKPPGRPIEAVGTLALTPNHDGVLHTQTTYDRFEVTVTPEPNTMIARPSHDPVMTTVVQRMNQP